ncbi:MAG: beta-aspartyl-peptidase, partial [Deltaproteobacteria bacterium]|nr:beta-aspartyl-peptidase [Nannocystaceae bacterium]
MLLLRDADVLAPEPLGRCDVLIAGERIVAIAHELGSMPAAVPCEVIELGGLRLVPGLVDA